MAWEIPGFTFSLPANADYGSQTSYLWTPVTAIPATGAGINTGAAAAPVAATGDPGIGILQNNPGLAEAATIMVNGISKALIKETVIVGDLLMNAPAGGLQKTTSGKYSVGQALQAGAPGDVIAVLLSRNGKL